ncbi:Aste57867_4773 [Aphanomyces stellatus]|uniref:Aste57867_4773 protein n=1 Tax=Aphanomyces stellatus TaxID=120398 RepID=A0A485KEG4_9STRA|nr:hypothetical protein As57867_004760 [Aphanomyces stellatus]VFT81868.1 Aste57867_4773 [Aphanomyces stellatus]
MAERVAPTPSLVVGTWSKQSSTRIVASKDGWLPAPLVTDKPPTRRQLLESIAGFLYVGVSVACSVWYTLQSVPKMTNDMWWSHFNTTGTQTFVGDLANAHLVSLDTAAPLDLFAAASAVQNDYSAAETSVAQSTVYPRHYMLGRDMSFEDAIQGMQQTSISFNLRMFTQYCWLDFDKRFQVAHTTARQARCAATEADNAAIHLEAMLRNVVWTDFVAGCGGPAVFVNFANPLREFAGGAAWLASVQDAFEDMATEVAYWRQKGLVRWQLQWHNGWQQGVDESVVVYNALGMSQPLAIKSVPYVHRGTGPWTSIVMFSGFWNDLGRSIASNFSIVQGASNHFARFNFSWESAISFNPMSVQTVLWHANVGKYDSIDMKFISVPHSLKEAAAAFHQQLVLAIQSKDRVLADYNAINEQLMDPVPSAWANKTYYGGNPMCIAGKGLPYVQQHFGFDDACLTQDPLTIATRRSSLVFSILAMGLSTFPSVLPRICAACATTPPSTCYQTIAAAFAVAQALGDAAMQSTMPAVVADINALNVSIMQFASDMATLRPSLLQQPLVSPNGDDDIGWTFFGLVQLLDWADHHREVVSFEGDTSTLTLMSRPYALQAFAPNKLQVARSASLYFVLLMSYVSVQLVIVAIVLVGYGVAARCRVLGRNLFCVNRMVGSVWIGRLVLLVRGLTAIMFLSTSNIELDSTSGFAKFVFRPRPWFDAALVAGEATWIVYILHDFLVIVAREYSAFCAPVSSILAFVSLFLVEMTRPIQASASLHRQCKTLVMGKLITCTSGTIQLGSVSRLQLILVIQAGSVAVAYLGAIALSRHWRPPTRPHLVIGGVAEAFLAAASTTDDDDALVFDNVTCVLCGILVFRVKEAAYMFDIKLWVLFHTPTNVKAGPVHHRSGSTSFHGAKLKRSLGSRQLKSAGSRVVKPNDVVDLKDSCGMLNDDDASFNFVDKAMAAIGFLYMIASLAGMFFYIFATSVNMANDLWWAGFNTTGAHAFLGNWYNLQLLLTPHGVRDELSQPIYADKVQYNTTSTVISSSPIYARHVQMEDGNATAKAIQGLRQMDACLVPWIATQYCWLDFARVYPMANTATRQLRCVQDPDLATNGAVYLESALRNLNWPRFVGCWGASFETAIASELRLSLEGQRWLDMTTTASATSSVSDEVAFWAQFNIMSYTTQYQNYKSIGIQEGFHIQNAFGVSYRMTIKATKGAFKFGTETTRKLYWTLAGDLWAVTSATPIAGRSLLASSASFAFANTTLEAILIANKTVASPFGLAASFFRSVVGPYGSVDAKHVPVPRVLRQFYKSTLQTLLPVITTSATNAQIDFFRIPVANSWVVVPTPWLPFAARSMGGSILCPEEAPYAGPGLLSYWQDSGCTSAIKETAYPTRHAAFIAALAIGLPTLNATAAFSSICTHETSLRAVCVAHLTALRTFVQTYIPQTTLDVAFVTAKRVQAELMAATNIHIFQILPVGGGPFAGQHTALFDTTTDRSFDFFAWGYVLEWVVGGRDVVTFSGDVGSLTLLSYTYFTLDAPPDPLETPSNVAFYFRCCILYVACVLLVVACLVSLHVVASRGSIEGWNIRKINRVGGVVWAGRPLLFLRSLVAISLISTSAISLEQYGPLGAMTAFSSEPLKWYTVLIVSLEVVWFADVVGDILVIFTKSYTIAYTLKCTVLVWVSSVALTFASPVAHAVTVDRSCSLTHVDFQLTCDAGAVHIGSVTRFYELIGISLGAMVLAYAYERLRHPHLQDSPDQNASLFLSSGARYLFQLDKWQYNGYCYLDKASGVINGILCVEHDHHYYMLDIKLWKTFVIRVPEEARVPRDHPMHSRLRCAFPLLDSN